MNEETDYRIISELVLLALDKSLSEEQAQQLNDLILNDPGARDYYLECIAVQVSLSNIECLAEHQAQTEELELIDAELWQSLASNEKTAAGIIVEKPKESDAEPEEVVEVQKPPRTISKFSLYTAIISSAALLLLLVSVLLNPPSNPVAVLTASIDAEWGDVTGPLEDKDDLYAGPVELVKGIAEITFYDGSVATIEGPAILSLEGIDQLYMQRGKLWAQCEHEAGFTVRTPSASVVDYGTEFGVTVNDQGYTRVYVSKGQVNLRAGSNLKVYEQSKRLTEGQAASVKNKSIVSLEVLEVSFVHSVESLEQAQEMFGRNLIVNGGFELDEGAVSNVQFSPNMQISGWVDDSPALVADYKVLEDGAYYRGGVRNEKLPPERGNNFFHSWHNSTISQTIDLSELSYCIDQGTVRYDLSGWLGGFGGQDNPIEFRLSFLDVNGDEVGEAQIGPVKPTDRNNQTGFVKRQKTGILPTDCRTILIELKGRQNRADEAADAYADNLELVLTSK